MHSDFRQRAFLPLMIPLAILGTIAVVVGLMAAILTFLPQEVGNVVAFMTAFGILGAVGLAATQESLDPLKKGGVAIAVAAPLVFGGALIATDLCGGEDLLCPSEFEPAIQFPAWAPIITSALPADFDPDSQSVTLPAVPPEEAEELVIVFENNSGISHNVFVSSTMERPGDAAGLLQGAEGEPAMTSTYSAGTEGAFFLPPDPAEYLYYCSIHEGMDGTLTVADGAEVLVNGEPQEAR